MKKWIAVFGLLFAVACTKTEVVRVTGPTQELQPAETVACLDTTEGARLSQEAVNHLNAGMRHMKCIRY